MSDPNQTPQDIDREETAEWLDALDSVLERDGSERAQYLLSTLTDKARRSGSWIPFSPHTAYINTIPPEKEKKSPGNHELEWKIRSLSRWNAIAMVVQANKNHEGVGGHIASYQSSATLYDVGYNHFFRAPTESHGGDLIYIQGHCSPGIYARAYLEGRLSEDDLLRFRNEVGGGGLPSYPHPWLMPDFWQFATVSMGLGPLMAIYQARFMKYMHNREFIDAKDRKVWCFCGDGEMDEPESLGAIDVAAREQCDNLVFVVNCNLQRLDGPVRGDGKIIQELEGVFRGAGWNVIKVVWGSAWDSLIAQDENGKLKEIMMDTVDGEYQNYKAKGGKFTRDNFFAKTPETAAMVANMSDDDIWRLNRGGHDPHKVFAAYQRAMELGDSKRPTVILAKTVKGYGMGEAGEGQNITHQQKKMGHDALVKFRDRFDIPVSDEDIDKTPFYRPSDDSDEIKYLKERRAALGGALPARRQKAAALEVPELSAFDKILQGSGDREISTTMAFVRILQMIIRDKNVGDRVVPIIPDEARTFGMEGMFRQLGIYSVVGQLYEPQDADQLSFYREDKKGQILEEGINEAGAMSSWIAAGTAYSNHNEQMIPFYIYYSMFGFQRIGDLAYAAGDMRARGFMVGGTAGRTTLNGEGLQHEDGHQHLLASTIPNCIAYDPCFSYELAVIIQDGMRRMNAEQEDVYYYLSVMNENYQQPAMPEGVEEGIRKGMYLLQSGDGRMKKRVQLLGSGTILREVIAAADLLQDDWGVAADVWSVTSFTELQRDGNAVDRHNLLHPDEPAQVSWVRQHLAEQTGPVVASTDYMRTYAELIRPFVPNAYYTLGTDGYGRSDTREKLRDFFEVDRRWVTLRALQALVEEGDLERSVLSEAIKKYGIDPAKPAPWTV